MKRTMITKTINGTTYTYAENPTYTHAEAQAINDFVERALDRCNGHHTASVQYSIQIELDIMNEQLGTKQGFDRIPSTLADNGMGYIGPNYETGYL